MLFHTLITFFCGLGVGINIAVMIFRHRLNKPSDKIKP